MANTKEKVYTAPVSILLTPKMKAAISDLAWRNRTNMRAMMRTMLETELAIQQGIQGNPKAAKLAQELLVELGLAEAEKPKAKAAA